MSLLLIAPVAGGQGVLEPVRDGLGLDGQLQVEVFAFVDELLRVHSHLLKDQKVVLRKKMKKEKMVKDFGNYKDTIDILRLEYTAMHV